MNSPERDKQEALIEGYKAREHIKALGQIINDGENIEKAMDELLRTADKAIVNFWAAAKKYPEIADKIARRNVLLPVNVGPISPPHDKRPAKERRVPYECARALELPIGEDLPIRTKGKGKSIKHDLLYYYIWESVYHKIPFHKDVAEGRASGYRLAPTLHSSELEKLIRELPELCQDTIKEWSIAIAEYLEYESNEPIDTAGSKLNQIALELESRNISKKKQRIIESLGGLSYVQRLQSLSPKDLSLEESKKLHRYLNLDDECKLGIHELKASLREQIAARLKSITK